MIIKGEKVTLRPITPGDFPKIVQWTADRAVGHFMEDDGYPETIEECESWHNEAHSNRHKQRFLITLKDGSAVGDIELDHITWRSGDAELRIRIGEKDQWNHGYGTDAVKTLLNHAFNNMKLSRIYLRVDRENKSAIRVYEKAGLKKEGRLTRPSASGTREIFLMRILAKEYGNLHQESLQHAG